MAVQHRHPRNIKVSLCSLSAATFAFENVDSALSVILHDAANYGHITKGGHVTLLKSGPRIAEARNQLVDGFAATDDDWLLMYDSDMVFPPDAMYRLLDDAYDGGNVPKRLIVGGLCFAGSLRPDGRITPTIYAPRQQDDGRVLTEVVWDYPRGEIVKVGATGAAFLLVHRSVFAKMRRPHPEGFGTMPNGAENSYPWFIEGVNGGLQFGEDVAFCMRARALGFDVWVDTGLRIGHLKTAELSEEQYLAWAERTGTLASAEEDPDAR